MGLSSETRGIAAGGWSRPDSSNIREIDYVTMAEAGNSIDFGDLITPTNYGCGTSSTTRGLLIGGYSSPSPQVYENRIEFITIASTGNGTDFGDVNATNTNLMSAASNATRGLIWGGGGDGSNLINNIEFVTIATTGNASDFGDMTYSKARRPGGASNAIRGLIAGGNHYDGSGHVGQNSIDFVTIATLGNATDFGDLQNADTESTTGCSSPTRAVFFTSPTDTGTQTNTLSYVQIMTTGNAIDFGDSTTNNRWGKGGTSNGHGGLG